MNHLIKSLIAVILVASFGCATVTRIVKDPVSVGVLTGGAVNRVLSHVSAERRAELAPRICQVSQRIYTLAQGHVPTVEEVRATMFLFSDGSAQYADLVTDLCGFYAAAYPDFSGNVVLANKYLESMSKHAAAASCNTIR